MLFVKREPWVDHAKCRGLDPNLFILGKGDRPDMALAVCNGNDGAPPCPVRAECRAHAEQTGALGVWGGVFFSDTRTVEVYDAELPDGRPRTVE